MKFIATLISGTMLVGAAAVAARTFTVHNACRFTIWPAVFTDLNVGSAIPDVPTGWEARPSTKRTFTVPSTYFYTFTITVVITIAITDNVATITGRQLEGRTDLGS